MLQLAGLFIPLQVVLYGLVGLVQVTAGPALHAMDLPQFLLANLLLALGRRAVDALWFILIVVTVDKLDLDASGPFEGLDELWFLFHTLSLFLVDLLYSLFSA